MITSPIDGPYDKNHDYNKWFVEYNKIFTLDILIGPKEFLGKGLAHIMIQKFILDKFPQADFFLIDPEQVNVKAIHVYEKAGFRKIGDFIPSFDSTPHIMMKLEVDMLH